MTFIEFSSFLLTVAWECRIGVRGRVWVTGGLPFPRGLLARTGLWEIEGAAFGEAGRDLGSDDGVCS